jgi:hypothetical protein
MPAMLVCEGRSSVLEKRVGLLGNCKVGLASPAGDPPKLQLKGFDQNASPAPLQTWITGASRSSSASSSSRREERLRAACQTPTRAAADNRESHLRYQVRNMIRLLFTKKSQGSLTIRTRGSPPNLRTVTMGKARNFGARALWMVSLLVPSDRGQDALPASRQVFPHLRQSRP